MKRTLLLTMSLLILTIMLSANLMDDDGKAGFTGSPGEVTCNTTSCHNSFVDVRYSIYIDFLLV